MSHTLVLKHVKINVDFAIEHKNAVVLFFQANYFNDGFLVETLHEKKLTRL